MGLLGVREASAAARTVLVGQLSRYGGSGSSQTSRFETELGRHLGVAHVRAMNSGTSALVAALAGLGIGPGDEVLVPAYTWVSTAAAVMVVGAVPVLVEIDESLTIDVEDARSKLTPRTKAVIPVHMVNLVCDMDGVVALAREHGLHVIEDACQAIGVTYRGRHVGTIGEVGAFSFNQHKNLRAGEGGALVSDLDTAFARASMYHDVGSYTRDEQLVSDEPVMVGMNFRMPEVTSAILRPQLRRLDRQIERRRRRRAMFVEELSTVAGLEVVPHHAPGEEVGLAVRFDDPDRAVAFGRARGAERVLDTGRHVYTNWEPVRSGTVFHGGLDPYAWNDDRAPGEDHCPRTLDIVERTCTVSLAPDLPVVALRRLASEMVAAVR